MSAIPSCHSAAEVLAQLRSAMRAGDLASAREIAENGLQDHPRDAGLSNAAGDLALKAGDLSKANQHFAAACSLAPQSQEYAINHAIALQRLGRHSEAIGRLDLHRQTGRNDARYASVRAMSHRALAEAVDAAHWYDLALAMEPGRARALHGRARVALQRGEPDAVERFDRALRSNPGDADLWLGKAQALEVAGDIKGARTIAEQLCEQMPGNIAALSFLSGLKLAAGEAGFAEPYSDAAARAPQDPNIAVGHCEALAGLDHPSEAAAVAAKARERFPNEPHFALLEAVHAGAAGEWNRAESIFATLRTDTPNRAMLEARHAIRARQTDRAQALLDKALEADPWDITAWAQLGILWRLADDPRAEWLHEQEGLIQMRELVAREGLIDDCISELRTLHAGSVMPLGQSLRGGTQTRGILFHRTEPLLGELHDAIVKTLDEYRCGLPRADKTHPFLRHRDAPWKLAGSWSVRLTGGSDHHAAHIHYQGILSSALYLVVPEEAALPEREGWLEIGRPKSDLGLDLAPIRTIKPVPGHLALFPSTAYHGTTPFRSAERMTVAFDAVADELS